MSSAPALVNCVESDPILPEEKFRVTFSQGAVENWFFGGTIQSIYSRLGSSPIVYVVSEPPLDADPVLVVDVRVRNTAVGSQLPGTVADLVNNLSDLTFYDMYDVTRLEQLSTSAPVIEQKSVVRVQALQDQAKSGVAGILGKATDAASSALGGVKGIALAATVIVVAVAALWAYAELKTARAA